jgi:hypothetical protein
LGWVENVVEQRRRAVVVNQGLLCEEVGDCEKVAEFPIAYGTADSLCVWELKFWACECEFTVNGYVQPECWWAFCAVAGEAWEFN